MRVGLPRPKRRRWPVWLPAWWSSSMVIARFTITSRSPRARCAPRHSLYWSAPMGWTPRTDAERVAPRPSSHDCNLRRDRSTPCRPRARTVLRASRFPTTARPSEIRCSIGRIGKFALRSRFPYATPAEAARVDDGAVSKIFTWGLQSRERSPCICFYETKIILECADQEFSSLERPVQRTSVSEILTDLRNSIRTEWASTRQFIEF